MSWTCCHDCGATINSDDDPGCFIEIGNMRRMTWAVPVCEACREERLADIERLAEAESRAMAEAERRAP